MSKSLSSKNTLTYSYSKMSGCVGNKQSLNKKVTPPKETAKFTTEETAIIVVENKNIGQRNITSNYITITNDSMSLNDFGILKTVADQDHTPRHRLMRLKEFNYFQILKGTYQHFQTQTVVILH